MDGGSRIIGLRPATDAELDEHVGAGDPSSAAHDGFDVVEVMDPPRLGWVVPVLGSILALAWAGAMLWFARDEFPMAPLPLAQFAATLCVPPILVAMLCLLSLRTSRVEAARFGATARAMRAESQALERTVATLGDRIEANRAALAEQAAALVLVGDAASERMRGLESDMVAESRILETVCSSLAQTAHETERSLATVVDSLPKAHADTAGITAALNSAGLAASERTRELAGHLAALGERARAADDVASGAASRLSAHIDRMESSTDVAAARLDDAAQEMSQAVDGVLDRASQAIDEARRGIAAQGEAMLAMLSASQAALEKTGRDGAEALQARLATVEETVVRIAARLGDEQIRSDELFADLTDNVDQASSRLDRLHSDGVAKSGALAASISALTVSTEAMNGAMQTGDGTARKLIATAEDLLTALDASAREIDETLPEALARLDERIAASRQVVTNAKPELLSLVTAAESTHDAVEGVAGLVTSEREKLQAITATLTEALDVGQDKAATMEEVVDAAIAKTRRFAEDAAPQLIEALTRIRETASTAADHARATLTSVVPEAASHIEATTADAVRRAFSRALPQPLAELSDASEAAVSAASRASEHLGHQLMTIAETTAAISARIEAEHADRETFGQENLGRRMSLLIEAMNSASIDIAKTLAPEVTDSAWAAYLKGDRGVFTRRAVRLLDSHEAREIARLHDSDPAFREHVNRYIHDFEGMLRQILALRDGSQLAVTLLSSDMGKLYVALAQAIERLRT